jgi:DnaK suppressor protein
MSIAQGEAREINQIDNALNKIEKGKYGVCECCGDNISKQRLMVIPFASLCIKCKEAEERDQEIMINRVEFHEFDEFEEVEKRNS